MKKIFTLFSAAFMMIAVDAQTTMTLSQTNDDVVPESAGILSCNNTDNAIMRLFDLSDYGITGNFTPTQVDAAAIIWNGGHANATIWNVPGVDYPESIPHEDFESTDFYGYYGNNSGERVWGWVTFETFDEIEAPLTPDTQFAVVITGFISNADAGWAESFVPLPSDGGFVKSSYFGAPTSECIAVDEGVVTRLDVAGFPEYSSTLLTVTGEAEGLGLISLDSRALSVYPNPATDVLNIDLGSNKVAESIEIVNLTGQSVMKSKAVEALDVSSLAPGVYIVRVKDADNVTHMTRIVKK